MNDLVPELHDVLKLTVLEHNFSDFSHFQQYIPQTRTWDGIYNHHLGEDYPGLPFDRDTFLLCFADSQASSFSRHLEGKYKNIVEQVEKEEKIKPFTYKIWNPPPQGVDIDPRLRKDDDIIALLQFLTIDPNFSDFKNRYFDIMCTRPEEMKVGRNVTSLLSHMVLTGKIYRLLKQSKVNILEESEIKPDREYLIQLTRDKGNRWKFFLALLKFDFIQNPFRARDFWIFDMQQEVMDKVSSHFPDNLLLRFENRLLLIYDDEEVFNEIIAMAKGLIISKVSAQTPIAQVKFPDPFRLPGFKGPEPNYPDLPDIIKPPLCEICQMAPAELTWPDDYVSRHGKQIGEEERKEELCRACFDIRQRPSRLKKFTSWSEAGDTLVAWVRRSLQYPRLVESLEELYWHYLKKFIPDMPREDVQIRFSLIEEFSRDYQQFIQEFHQALSNKFGEENCETLNDWLWCIKLNHNREVFDILESYHQALKHHFPALKDMESSPISLVVAICNAKFPFFQIWRQMQDFQEGVKILLRGHGGLTTDNRHLEALLMAKNNSYPKTALHGLAEVAKISEALAGIKFADRWDKRDHPVYEQLKKSVEPLGLDFRSLLTFARLLED